MRTTLSAQNALYDGKSGNRKSKLPQLHTFLIFGTTQPRRQILSLVVALTISELEEQDVGYQSPSQQSVSHLQTSKCEYHSRGTSWRTCVSTVVERLICYSMPHISAVWFALWCSSLVPIVHAANAPNAFGKGWDHATPISHSDSERSIRTLMGSHCIDKLLTSEDARGNWKRGRLSYLWRMGREGLWPNHKILANWLSNCRSSINTIQSHFFHGQSEQPTSSCLLIATHSSFSLALST